MQAKERFIHTFKNLDKAILAPNLIAVRWLHSPNALNSENEEMVFELISRKRGNNNFKLIYLHSEYNNNLKEGSNFIRELSVQNSKVLTCCLQERQGFNGDLSKNFRGDSRSWESLLAHALKVFEL